MDRKHAAEDVLERFAMDKLGEAEAGSVEEHLLVCPICCDRVAWLDAFVESMRSAAHAVAHAAGAGPKT